MRNVEEIAKEIRENQEWDLDLCKEFAEAAGLKKEWDEADGDTFESVIFKAAKILGVEIL